MAGQVARYVSALAKRASGRALFFLAVPAPLRSSGERAEVIALFNAALEKCAAAGGHRYVDLYGATLSGGGYADEKFYIDKFHLKPEVLQAAF